MSCLNPFDVQSRHIMSDGGHAETLYAGCGGRGGQQYVLLRGKRSGNADQTTRQGYVPELYARSTDSFDTKGAKMSIGLVEKDGTVIDEDTKRYEERVQEMDAEFDPGYDYAVRRLTPTECAALQGFPKDWCADVPHSDSAEYKLWGNGIALPSILGLMQNAVNVVKGEQP